MVGSASQILQNQAQVIPWGTVVMDLNYAVLLLPRAVLL
jgi:hypothetical protein